MPDTIVWLAQHLDLQLMECAPSDIIVQQARQQKYLAQQEHTLHKRRSLYVLLAMQGIIALKDHTI